MPSTPIAVAQNESNSLARLVLIVQLLFNPNAVLTTAQTAQLSLLLTFWAPQIKTMAPADQAVLLNLQNRVAAFMA